MTRHAAILALALASAGVPATAGEIRQTTTYFDVGGLTLEEIDADLQRKGPVVGTAGSRHPGATSVRFDGHVSYRRDGRRCAVEDIHLNLDLEMVLPRWRPRGRAAPEVALIWRVLADDIERHEREHSGIARSWLRRMESALRNLAPQSSCDAMERKVQTTVARYLRDHERAQREFDVREGQDVNNRLRRSLERRLESGDLEPGMPTKG